MKRMRGGVVDVTSLDDFDRRVGHGARDLAGWRIDGVDLRERDDTLTTLDGHNALFIGCDLAEPTVEKLREDGALVLPHTRSTPVRTNRSALYTPAELYDADHYDQSFDARAYAWSQPATWDSESSPERLRVQALHDHTIDQALLAWVETRDLVGVMGGHALRRGERGYADGARLGHALGSRLTIATGGGPGAMEAANLGAGLARHSPADLKSALRSLGRTPGFRPSIDTWARAAFEVIDHLGGSAAMNPSLGIPTWHYGHEPPNVLATTIAKYFRNATREAILLQICDAGIVFLPGAAGTVQEVFQDACENYYADPSSVAPMVLVGTTYWTETLPVWPLLRALARERPMEDHVHLVDTVDEAAELVLNRPQATGPR